MGMGFKFQMGMGMKSLKLEGIGTKNLFTRTSSSDACEAAQCTQFGAFRLVLTFLYFSCLCLCACMLPVYGVIKE